MGNTNSTSGVTIDELKDQIFGSAVFMLSQRLDTELTFVDLSNEQLEGEYKAHTLPIASSSKPIEAASQYYMRENARPVIEKYVNEHILDTPEHVSQFINLLVAKLRPNRRDVESRRSATQRPPVAPRPTKNTSTTNSTREAIVDHRSRAEAAFRAEQARLQEAASERSQVGAGSQHTSRSSQRSRTSRSSRVSRQSRTSRRSRRSNKDWVESQTQAESELDPLVQTSAEPEQESVVEPLVKAEPEPRRQTRIERQINQKLDDLTEQINEEQNAMDPDLKNDSQEIDINDLVVNREGSSDEDEHDGYEDADEDDEDDEDSHYYDHDTVEG